MFVIIHKNITFVYNNKHNKHEQEEANHIPEVPESA